MAYDNTTTSFSEVTRTLTPQNWMDHGIKVLSLWFFGDAGNVPGQLYIKVNGVIKDYEVATGDLAIPKW